MSAGHHGYFVVVVVCLASLVRDAFTVCLNFTSSFSHFPRTVLGWGRGHRQLLCTLLCCMKSPPVSRHTALLENTGMSRTVVSFFFCNAITATIPSFVPKRGGGDSISHKEHSHKTTSVCVYVDMLTHVH